ncbi:MAG: hypothetical protein SF051_05060 [Elusimicrobiota bacterium]|nr:hypothetical protein [Elusimicrobiota bacterium]
MSEKDLTPESALREIEAISSLDTARMTLRWALERLRLLEARVATAEERLTAAAAERDAAGRAREEERRAALTARQEAERAKALNARLEARLAELGSPGATAAAFARLEVELAEREKNLLRREERLREAAAAEQALAHDELAAARERAEREAHLRVGGEHAAEKRALAGAREELSARFVSLHEDEVRLRARERALEERAARLEKTAEAMAAELERTAAAQSAVFQGAARARLDAELRLLQDQWASERKILLKELAAWRERAGALTPEVLALSTRLQSAEEESARLRAVADAVRVEAARLDAELAAVRDATRAETGRRARAETLAQEHALRVEELQAALRAQEKRAEAAAAARDELQKLLAGRDEALAKVEDELDRRLRETQNALIAQHEAWAAREEAARRDGTAWSIAMEARKREADEALAQIALLRRELVDELARRRKKPSAS